MKNTVKTCFLFLTNVFVNLPTEISTPTCHLRPTTTTSPQWRIFHTSWIASGVHLYHPFRFPSSHLMKCLHFRVLSGSGGWRRGRQWTWSSAVWTTLKPGWPSTKWALNQVQLLLTDFASPSSMCSCSDVFICRPAMNWVRPGWSRVSVRTPCRDTSSSSSPERRRVSL